VGTLEIVIVPRLESASISVSASAMVRLADEPSLTLTAVCVPARLGLAIG